MAHQFPFIDTSHSNGSNTIANLRSDYTEFGVDSSLNLSVDGTGTFNNTVSLGATVNLTGTLIDDRTQVGAAGSILSSTGSGIRWIAANTTSVDNASNVGTNVNSADATNYLAFLGGSTGNNPIRVNTNLQYNPSLNQLKFNTAGSLLIHSSDESSFNWTKGIQVGYDSGGPSALFMFAYNGHGYISDRDGELRITSDSSPIRIRTLNYGGNPDSGIDMATFTPVSSVNLFFNGTERIRTADGGVVVTGICTATTFNGSLTGNADTATTATTATNVTVTANNSADETVYPIFVDGTTGGQGAESDTGLTYNPSSGAITAGSFVKSSGTSSQFLKADGSVDSTTYLSSVSSDIPSGTVMLFYQASAPTGWTQVTTQNNKALRVVNGTGAGTGGNNNFTTVFSNQSVSGTTGSTVSGSTSSDNSGSVSISGSCGGTQYINGNTTQVSLSVAQLAAHQHAYDVPRGTSGGDYGFLDTMNSGSSGTPSVASTGSGDTHHHAIVNYAINGSNFTFSGSGSPSDHDHDIGNHSHSFSDSVDMRVQYIDVIICSKD